MLRDPHGNVGDPLQNDEAKLSEETAYLVAMSGACFDEALAFAVKQQYQLLLDVLDRH